jgi:hypothetical protein
MLRLLSLTLLLVVLLAVPAQASRSQVTYFEAPRDLLDAGTRDGALDEIKGLGVGGVRIVMLWSKVAPDPSSRVAPSFDQTDPAAYDWSTFDAAVDGARARGLSVLLTVSGPVPRWATNGARDTVTRPSPAGYRKFMTAVARHFDDRVASYSIWNEPNQPQFLMPQYDKRHRPVSPKTYRGLFQAGQRGLHEGGSSKPILFGETSPRGTGKVVAPLTFLRGALCLSSSYKRDRKCSKLDIDGYAHHAYTTRQGPFFVPPGPNDVTIGVLGRLTTALDRAARAGAIAKGMGINLTEFGIQSTPDPIYGVSLAQQEEYRAISERLAYYNPRVKSFSQYLLRDDEPKLDRPPVSRYPGFESGLRRSDGRAKPALDGFRLPLVAKGTGSKTTLWGLVRPAGGATQVTIEQADRGKGFHDLATVTTDSRGYFTRRTANRSGRRWRLRWTAPGGTVRLGAPIRAYR